MKKRLSIEVPYPPSVNRYWRQYQGRAILSREARAYRAAITATMLEQGVKPLSGQLALSGRAHPPDRRRRDLDNLLKALFDGLQHGGACEDDAQIRLFKDFGFGDVVQGGLVRLKLEQMEKEA